MTIGDIICPRNIPNLNQILFKGVKNLEFKIPKIKNIIPINIEIIFKLHH